MIAANMVFPTDVGLLARAVGKLVRAARRVQAAGGATGTGMRDRRRAAGRPAREMAATMRARARLGRDESSAAIGRMTGDLADLAKAAAAQAAAVLRNGRRAVRRALSGRVRGRLRRALGELAVTIDRTATVLAQARSRLAGQMPDGATRLVSLHDPEARPIRKGRTDPPGRGSGTRPRCWKTTMASSWTTAWNAAPPDGPQLAPAIERVRRLAAGLQVHGAGHDVDALVLVRVCAAGPTGASSPSWMLVAPPGSAAGTRCRSLGLRTYSAQPS